MTKVSFITTDYIAWLAGPKSRVEQARQSAALSVNRELVSLYWQIGREILERQRRQGVGREGRRPTAAGSAGGVSGHARVFSAEPEVHAYAGRGAAR
jgi:hypothetical protein